MEEYGQLLFVFMNFLISGIFCKMFGNVYFRRWCLLTFFLDVIFGKMGKIRKICESQS